MAGVLYTEMMHLLGWDHSRSTYTILPEVISWFKTNEIKVTEQCFRIDLEGEDVIHRYGLVFGDSIEEMAFRLRWL